MSHSKSLTLLIAVLLAVISLTAQTLLELRVHTDIALSLCVLAIFSIPILFRASLSELCTQEKAERMLLGKECLLLAATLFMAAYFRFYDLDGTPPGLNHDSVLDVEYTLALLQGDTGFVPFFQAERYGTYGVEPLFAFIAYPFFKMLGVAPIAIKATSAVIGMAGVLAVYFLARFWFGVRIALWASLLLSLTSWHFIMNRTGWRCNLAVPLESMALLALLHTLRKPSLGSGLWAGIVSALNLYTYTSGRILLVKFALLIPFLKRESVRRLYSSRVMCLAFLLGFVAVAAPLLRFIANNWSVFWMRSYAISLIGPFASAGSWWEGLWRNLKATLLFLNYRANGDDFFLDRPLLDLPFAALFTLGLAIAISLWREERFRLLLVWFASSLIPGLLSSPNPNRNMAAIVPVVIIMALPIEFGLRAFTNSLRGITRLATPLTALLVGAFTLALCAVNQILYISPATRRDIWGFYPEARVVGEYMSTIMDRYGVVVADNFPLDILTFLTYRGGSFKPRFYHLMNMAPLVAEAQFTSVQGRGVAFVAKPYRRNLLIMRMLVTRFPHSKLVELFNTYEQDVAKQGQVVAWALLIPGSDIDREREGNAVDEGTGTAPK